ncbi:MAG: hypothetical protein ACTSRP_18855, partial [Candidatus Helarchaeota archaeon]
GWLFKYTTNWKEKLGVVITVALGSGIISSFISPINFCGLWFISLPFMGIIGTVSSYLGKKLSIIPIFWISSISLLLWIKYGLIIINIPHIIAIGVALLSLYDFSKIKQENLKISIKIIFACIIGTISEWCALNIYATFILNLPAESWYFIMPLVYIERSFGAFGGAILSIILINLLTKLEL